MTTDVDVPKAGNTESIVDRILTLRTRRPVSIIFFYWVVLVVCVGIATYPTGKRLAQEAADGAITTYIFVLPFLAAVAAQGIARRRAGELPIHDRQTDNIVGGLA
ncbi:MAG: hypothetical protein WBA81_06190, partial [Rhodococcus sp. (in: high G+C Gram-positive bacteria)]